MHIQINKLKTTQLEAIKWQPATRRRNNTSKHTISTYILFYFCIIILSRASKLLNKGHDGSSLLVCDDVMCFTCSCRGCRCSYHRTCSLRSQRRRSSHRLHTLPLWLPLPTPGSPCLPSPRHSPSLGTSCCTIHQKS